MDQLAHFTYDITQDFPKDERFGLVSQMRRASISVILNYIEGFARQSKAQLRNFLEISYGSLKELKYLFYFTSKRRYLSVGNYEKGLQLTERIGKMIWGILIKIKTVILVLYVIRYKLYV